MSAKYICDGCGREETATKYPNGDWGKPEKWYQRSDDEGIQDACSRDCIEKIADKTGKTKVVLPI